MALTKTKWAVPYTIWVSDDNYISPAVLIIEAVDEDEAIDEAIKALCEEFGGDINIWNYDEDGDEEGYILGVPIKV